MRHVTAVFDSPAHAARALTALQEQRFTDRDYSVVVQADAKHGGAAGALGRAMAHENLQIGPLGAGMLGAALAGTAVIASAVLLPALPVVMVAGAAAGFLARKGEPTFALDDAQTSMVEQALARGGALVIVHVETDDGAALAQATLARAQPVAAPVVAAA
jgi:hypothetical protein